MSRLVKSIPRLTEAVLATFDALTKTHFQYSSDVLLKNMSGPLTCSAFEDRHSSHPVMNYYSRLNHLNSI